VRYVDPGAEPARHPGVARTEIDYRRDNLVGSLGYLCGLEPGPNEAGGLVSSYEPAGTFLGAKLSLAFR
jgi:hypothetical protein